MRIDVIGRDQQAGGDGKAGGAEREGDSIDMCHVDAGKLRAELFLSNRTDCLSGIGQAQHEPQEKGDGEHDTEADHTGQRQKSNPEVDDSEGVIEVDCAGIGAKRIEQHVFDHHREPERHQENIAILSVRGRTDDEALQAVAQHEEHRGEHNGREIRVEPEEPMREESGKHCGSEQRAMRKIDDVQDAVD